MSEAGHLLPLLYAHERTYGWSVGMRAITLALLSRVVPLKLPLLEIGAGGGAFLHLLAQRQTLFEPAARIGTFLIGIDHQPLALHYASQSTVDAVSWGQADLHHLPFAASSIGSIVALDTFDQHAVELQAGLRESWRVLSDEGLLIMRVSAHAWLSSPHDRAFNTGHRYIKETLVHALRECGFTPCHVTHANTLLLPSLAIWRFLQRVHVIPWRADVYHAADRSALAHRLLARVLQAEARWLRYRDFGIGVSLYALARKNANYEPFICPKKTRTLSRGIGI